MGLSGILLCAIAVVAKHIVAAGLWSGDDVRIGRVDLGLLLLAVDAALLALRELLFPGAAVAAPLGCLASALLFFLATHLARFLLGNALPNKKGS